MGFQTPNPFKVNPSIGEELFNKAWLLMKDEVLRLTQEGWDYSLRGKSDDAVRSYQGANIYYYFVFTAQAARYKLDLLGKVNDDCNSILIDDEYGLTCIENNLPCLSTHFDTDYRKVWDEIMELFGIDRQVATCDTCCIGIGTMTIDDPDDCVSFIIGTCADITPYIPTPPADFGEWSLGEWGLTEFTNFNE